MKPGSPAEQLQLGLVDLETAIAKADADAEKRDPNLRKDRTAKPRASHGALATHLPRIEMVSPESTAWEGVGDAAGAPLPLSPEAVERLMDFDDIAAAFWDRATAPVAAVALEGNG